MERFKAKAKAKADLAKAKAKRGRGGQKNAAPAGGPQETPHDDIGGVKARSV